jgi:NAD(P)-dependent dehydrogenase (short-subunit alcohol dehydrogenase family)
MDLELAGKRAVVTGASRGIGLAAARQLSREGADVVIAARHLDALQTAAASISAETGGRVIPMAVDTGQDNSVREFVSQAVNSLGGVDILVNSAARPGRGLPAQLSEVTTDVFLEQLNVKVMGYLRTAREVAPFMISQGWGRIINVSGLGSRHTVSIVGSIRNVGVSALTKNLADELGPKGINVTVVHPGNTRTEATADLVAAQAQELGVDVAEVERRLGTRTTLGRIVDAAEIAWVIAFLASPKSVAISGDSVAVGGGDVGAIYY